MNRDDMEAEQDVIQVHKYASMIAGNAGEHIETYRDNISLLESAREFLNDAIALVEKRKAA